MQKTESVNILSLLSLLAATLSPFFVGYNIYMCRIDVGGYTFYTFLLLRIKPYLAGNPVRSQGFMMSYANDVTTQETHINTGYREGVP